MNHWKVIHIAKGILTYVPMLERWRTSRGATGGTDNARYCYSVWLRHLILLNEFGFKVTGANVGELGPGDSIGIGLAALLSGAKRYTGLDIVPFSAQADLGTIFDELVRMYCNREVIPDHEEFPGIQPQLTSYRFPSTLVDYSTLDQRAIIIKEELKKKNNHGDAVCYLAPWNSDDAIARASLDLIFSQAVLEHVDDLKETYSAMAAWLRPGGYASHVIDFSAHYLSPYWNGHWAYSDLEWLLVRGCRDFLLNREPLSTHLRLAESASFEVLRVMKFYDKRGLDPCLLAKKFKSLNSEDIRTRGAMLMLRKRI